MSLKKRYLKFFEKDDLGQECVRHRVLGTVQAEADKPRGLRTEQTQATAPQLVVATAQPCTDTTRQATRGQICRGPEHPGALLEAAGWRGHPVVL